MMRGKRFTFRLQKAGDHPMLFEVNGRVTNVAGNLHVEEHIVEALLEIEQLVNDQRPHLRLHISLED